MRLRSRNTSLSRHTIVRPSGDLPMNRTFLRAFLAFALAVAAGSCGEPAPAPSPTVSVVELSPGRDTLTYVGKTRQLSAVVKDASGATLSGRTITWTSSNTAVATVSPTGLVTAVA